VEQQEELLGFPLAVDDLGAITELSSLLVLRSAKIGKEDPLLDKVLKIRCLPYEQQESLQAKLTYCMRRKGGGECQGAKAGGAACEISVRGD
jgi:hypothetical protein